MERRVKERLIGASILVLLIVLVVPELLSGPKPPALRAGPEQILPAPSNPADPVRNVTLDLATSQPAAVEPATGASAASEAPGPAAPDASRPAATAATPPQAMAAPARTAPPPTSAPTVTTEPASGGNVEPQAPPASKADWSVQLGSFANRDNADTLLHKLRAQGFAAFVSPTGSGRAARYRVRVGPFGERGAAERSLSKLKDMGHQGSLVKPTRQ